MICTKAYCRISTLTKRIKVIQGGQGASKTYSILQKIYNRAKEDKIKATVVTATYPQLKDGVIADMKIICMSRGLNFEDYYSKQDKNLNIFGSEIQFRNIDNKDFHKSKGVRRDILYINEANRAGWASVDQLMTRSKEIYLDYNPDSEFWMHEHVLNRDDTELLILTYLDNEMISPEEKKEIESRRGNLQWWRVYGEGQLGIYSDKQIYNYEFTDKIPDDARRLPSGIDFGMSPDPTAFINVWKKGSDLYVDEIFCLNNLLPEKLEGAERQAIVDKLDEVKHSKGHLIIADSAGATEIRDMRKHRYNVRGVKKGTGSVIIGINKLRGYTIHITRRSINLKKGIENWHFKEDHNGKIIPTPDGHEPDTLAALRYVIMETDRSNFKIL